ncbi:MAG: hypothetical protein O3A46_00345 [Candidatus Poribacteria bacterium]|nr:hypothetical protein [Candidatus Poribacteria bacterium]
MTRTRSVAMTMLIASVLTVAAGSANGVTLEAFIRDARASAYGAPSIGEMDEFRLAVASLLDDLKRDGEPSNATIAAFRALDFACESVTLSERRYIVVRDTPEHVRGGGLYVFRPDVLRGGAATITFTQAPHVRYDLFTGEIAARVFERTDAAVLAVNTAHRYVNRALSPGSDLAHEPVTFFQAATIAVCDSAETVVYQFHGFSAANRPSEFDRRLSIILSDGRQSSVKSARFNGLVRRLGNAVGSNLIGVYGVNTNALGAVTNAQARHINAQPRGSFVHVELSDILRSALRDDKTLMNTLSAAFRDW